MYYLSLAHAALLTRWNGLVRWVGRGTEGEDGQRCDHVDERKRGFGRRPSTILCFANTFGFHMRATDLLALALALCATPHNDTPKRYSEMGQLHHPTGSTVLRTIAAATHDRARATAPLSRGPVTEYH